MGCRSKPLYQVVEKIKPVSIGVQAFVQKNVRGKLCAPHCKTNSKLILKDYDKNLLQSNDHSKNCEIPIDGYFSPPQSLMMVVLESPHQHSLSQQPSPLSISMVAWVMPFSHKASFNALRTDAASCSSSTTTWAVMAFSVVLIAQI